MSTVSGESHDRHRPTAPSDLADAPRRVLFDALTRHEGKLVDARADIGRPQSPGLLQAAALDALACGQALAENVLRHRWFSVVEAFQFGATAAQVGTACGLDVDEIAAGVRSWVSGQVEHAGMPRAEHDRIVALVEARLNPAAVVAGEDPAPHDPAARGLAAWRADLAIDDPSFPPSLRR